MTKQVRASHILVETKEQAEQVFRERVEREGLGIYNDIASNLPNAFDERLGIEHFLSNKDIPNVRTFNNTIKRPDITFNKIHYFKDGTSALRNVYIKKYNVNDSKNFDINVLQGKEAVTKYKANANHVKNKLAEPVQDVSLQRRVFENYGGEIHSPVFSNPSASIKSILSDSVNVKKNTPNLKRIPDFGSNYGRRYSPQYLTPYLAQYLANQQ